MRRRGGNGSGESHDPDASDEPDDNWPFGALGLGPDGEPLDQRADRSADKSAGEPVGEPADDAAAESDVTADATDWDVPTQGINHIIFGQGISATHPPPPPGPKPVSRTWGGSRRLTNPDDGQQPRAMNEPVQPSGLDEDAPDWDMPTQAINHIIFGQGVPSGKAPSNPAFDPSAFNPSAFNPSAFERPAFNPDEGTSAVPAIDEDAGTPTRVMPHRGALFGPDADIDDSTELINQPLLRPPYTRNLPLGEHPTATFPFAGLSPTVPSGTSGPMPPRPPGGATPERTHTRTLVWVAVGLVGVLILAALFFLGTQLSSGPAAAPLAPPVVTPSTSASPVLPPAPTPEPVAPVAGPVAPGEHAWDELLGGECLQPYSTPWEEDFTVVECDAPHAAQMVHMGAFDYDAGATFPGEEELAGKINVLCSTPDVIDFDTAKQYSDIQIQGSYPVTEEQWDAGQRSYYCFVNRSSGDPIEGSLAAAG